MLLGTSILAALLFVLYIIELRTKSRLRSMLEKQTFRLREARKILKMRSRLANELAHEIKNPLAAIQCSAETIELLSGKKLPPEHRESLRYIQEYSRSLGQLLQDFLDLSSAEAGELNPKKEVFLLYPLLEAVTGLLRSKAYSKNIKFEFDTANINLAGLADARHMKQVVFNILHNAIKFSPEASKIKLVTGIVPEKDEVCIQVIDEGPGLTELQINKLFDPEYVNSDSAMHIGLRLSKSLVELSNGSLLVQSEHGSGSCFEIRMPIAKSSVKVDSSAYQLLPETITQ